jgi:hypothetical protein
MEGNCEGLVSNSVIFLFIEREKKINKKKNKKKIYEFIRYVEENIKYKK